MGKKWMPRLLLQQRLGMKLSPFEGTTNTAVARSHVIHPPHNLTHSRTKKDIGWCGGRISWLLMFAMAHSVKVPVDSGQQEQAEDQTGLSKKIIFRT